MIHTLRRGRGGVINVAGEHENGVVRLRTCDARRLTITLYGLSIVESTRT